MKTQTEKCYEKVVFWNNGVQETLKQIHEKYF